MVICITFQVDILIMQWLILAFKIRLNQLGSTTLAGAFKTIYYGFNNQFETIIDAEVRVWVMVKVG